MLYHLVSCHLGIHVMCSNAGFSDVHFVLEAELIIVGRHTQSALTLVSVPVLSEQITLTAPSVSTVFSDLQRILFLRIMFAVIVKEAVKAMGRPSGIKAMATETQSTIRVGTFMKPGWFTRR